MLREMDIDDPRLHDGVTVTQVDFDDPLHACQADHQPAAHGQCAPGERSARPAWEKGHIKLVA